MRLVSQKVSTTHERDLLMRTGLGTCSHRLEIARVHSLECPIFVSCVQPEGDVVIGSARELATRAKGSVAAAPGGNQKDPAVGEEEEGAFWGMARLAASGGSVMVWDTSHSEGEATVSTVYLAHRSVWVIGERVSTVARCRPPLLKFSGIPNNEQQRRRSELKRVLRVGSTTVLLLQTAHIVIQPAL